MWKGFVGLNLFLYSVLTMSEFKFFSGTQPVPSNKVEFTTQPEALRFDAVLLALSGQIYYPFTLSLQFGLVLVIGAQ